MFPFFRSGGEPVRKPLAELSPEAVLEHIERAQYGDFLLTDAIRPSSLLEIEPKEGFRDDLYEDLELGERSPVLMAAASAEKLFELFLSLVEELGPVVDVVIESSHTARVGEQLQNFLREEIDRSVLLSKVIDFRDLLLNDGCCGIAVIEQELDFEIQFDEHKMIIVYYQRESIRKRIVDVFQRFGIAYDPHLRFLTEGEHVHSSEEKYTKQFLEFATALSCCDLNETPEEEDLVGEQEVDDESPFDASERLGETPWSQANPDDDDDDDLLAC